MKKNKKIACGLALTAVLSGLAGLVLAETPRTQAQYEADPAAMIEAYAHVEVASVSDALEQVLHQKRYMSHKMQSIFPAKFAGFAVTVLGKIAAAVRRHAAIARGARAMSL